jgi:hypothetical protein
MSGTATDAADDVCGEVALFWAIVLAVADVSAVLADLVLVVAERAVECSELAELVPLVVVLTLRRGSGL